MMDVALTVDLLRRRADLLHRERPVVTNGVNTVRRSTLGEVLDRAGRLAWALQGLGIGRGDRVGTLAWNQQEHLEAYVAVPCMGAVLHTLNLRLSPEQIAWIVDDADDRVILVDHTLLPIVERVRPLLRGDARFVTIPGEYEELLDGASDEPFPWPELDEDEAAAMCFTSGTTGDPKGVVYSHRSTVLHTLNLLLADGAAISAGDVVMPVVPMFHANAWGIPYAALAAGSALVLPGPHLQPKPLADLLETERVTVAAGVPTIWHGLAEELRARPRELHLRCVPCGGAAVPEVLMRAFDEVTPGTLLHAWGMTETSPIGSCATLPAGHEEWDAERALRFRLTQGRAVLGVELRIWALDDREAPWDGQTLGELQVRGPWVAASYWKERDADRWVDGWFRTGDVVVGNPDGTFQVADRTKDVIKSGGEWISSVALEGTVLQHPAVREAAVIGRPDEHWSERPVACVALQEGQALELSDLRAWLEGRVPGFWLPDDLVVLEELPKTGVGKLDKRALRASYASSGRVATTS
jgi:fatty-acyl-CoA synthase